MNNKIFEMPTAEIIVFAAEDVITASGATRDEAELPKLDF